MTTLLLGGLATGNAAASDAEFFAQIEDNGDDTPEGDGDASFRHRVNANVYEFDFSTDFQNVANANEVTADDIDVHVHAGGTEIVLEDHGDIQIDRDVQDGDDDVSIEIRGQFSDGLVTEDELADGAVDVHIVDFDPDPAASGAIQRGD